MCAYQRINNSYACHQSKAQNGLLKTELGFEGFIVTDWRALRKSPSSYLRGPRLIYTLDAGVAAAEGGLDMAMPNGSTYWGAGGENLVKMVQNGSVEESRINDSKRRYHARTVSFADSVLVATRIVATWYQMEQDVSTCFVIQNHTC